MKNLIAKTLKGIGFWASIQPQGVLVGFSRPMSRMEIEETLNREFDVEFKLEPINEKWLIVVEE